MNTSKSNELVKSPENLDDPSSPAFDMLVKVDSPVTNFKTGEHSNEPEMSGSITTYRSEQITTCVDRVAVSEASVLEQLSTSEPQTTDRFEQIEIAPGTPIRCSTSARLFGSPDSPKVPNSNAVSLVNFLELCTKHIFCQPRGFNFHSCLKRNILAYVLEANVWEFSLQFSYWIVVNIPFDDSQFSFFVQQLRFCEADEPESGKEHLQVILICYSRIYL